MSKYVPVLEQMTQPYFVTLTKKTVSADQLENSIKLMEDTWRRTIHSDAGKRIKIRGIRKCECTIRPNDHYHFHYHVIVEGEEAAKWLVDSWLKRLPGLADEAAQDVKLADDGSIKEIFKYFTKLITNTGYDKKQFFPPQRMDVIFQVMKNKRVIQPFGGLKGVDEDIDFTNKIYNILDKDFDVWKWDQTDWYNENGEALSGYKPSEKFKELVDRINSADSEIEQQS